MMKKIQLILLLLICALLNSCGGGDSSSTIWNNNNHLSHRLQKGESTELLQTIRKQLLTQYAEVGTAHDTSNATIYHTASASTAASANAFTSHSTSSTNVQENGVDEADRLKSDGEYLFVASVDKPVIMVFSADAQASRLAELSLSSEQLHSPLKGFYLNEQQVTALSSPYRFGAYSVSIASDIAYAYSSGASTEIFTIDVTQPTQPKQGRKLRLDGELVSSRMIGSQLYLTTRHAINLPGLVYPSSGEEATANRAKINVSGVGDFLPGYAINGVEQGALFAANDCFKTAYSKDNHALSIISVLSLDTANPNSRPQGQCFLGDIETLYASTSALYLATTSYNYTTEDGRALYSGTVNTDLHRFELNDGAVRYTGSGRVNGHLGWYQDLKPFRLSEYENTLRVIAYTGDAVTTTQSPAHLYNLQPNATSGELEVVGQLPNNQRPATLGKPGEQVYATRFVGKRGYLVTYRLTDPLYILDLSDPRDPYIAGELEIEGYSDYLHPVGETMLLGVGKDAVVTNINVSANNSASNTSEVVASESVEVARGAWYQGVKLSLIDVSNPQLPTEIQTMVMGKRGSNTAVSQSHHAFTSLQEGSTLRVALPLSRHETVHDRNSYYHPNMAQYYYGWTQDELLRLDIDLDNQLMIERVPLVSEQAGTNADYTWSQHGEQDRSVLIGDRVYYLHGDKVLTTLW